MNKSVKNIIKASFFVCLATVLSFFQFNSFWAFGGSVTFCSMLPLLFYSYNEGFKRGLLVCFCFAILQILFSMNSFFGISPFSFFFSLILDYFLAYGVLAFSCFFKFFKNERFSFTFACAVCIFFRFVIHVVSGMLIFSSLVPPGMGVFEYAFLYNFSYMFLELIITCFFAFINYKIILKCLKRF